MTAFRPNEYPHDRCVTGPHVASDEGEPRLVFRCEICGTVSADQRLREGCWVCDGGVGWR